MFLVIVVSNLYFLGSWLKRVLPAVLTSIKGLISRVKMYRQSEVRGELQGEVDVSVSYSQSRNSVLMYRAPDNTSEMRVGTGGKVMRKVTEEGSRVEL